MRHLPNTMLKQRRPMPAYLPLLRAAGAVAALAATVLLSGCHIDQWDQDKLRPYAESTFFADRASSRPLDPHTVPVGPVEADDPAFYTGYVNGRPVKVMPARAVKDFASPKEMLLRGQDRFYAYCTPCHGKTGNGNGFVMQRGLGYWQKLAASYHTDRLRKIEDGYIYDVLVNGHGVMYGYGERIKSPDDRWAVVAYVRALQMTERPAAGGTAPVAPNTVAEPSLNAVPAGNEPTTTVEPGTERPINRTPGGDRTVRPEQPGIAPVEPTDNGGAAAGGTGASGSPAASAAPSASPAAGAAGAASGEKTNP